MVECPKCGGEMHEGEAFVHVSPLGSQIYPSYGMFTLPGMGVLGSEPSEERILWRERTGQKTGWLGSEEVKTMKVIGRRCTKCGYIELHSKE